MKSKIINAFIAALSCTVSCTNVPENGMLPKDYSWAYGFWEVTEVSAGSAYALSDGTYDNSTHYYLYLGNNYIQISEPYTRISNIQVDDFYPIYTFPKLEYFYNDDLSCGTSKNNDDLVLSFSGPGDYNTNLYLHKKSKSVSEMSNEYVEQQSGKEVPEDWIYKQVGYTSKKIKMKVDENVILEYDNAISSSPIWGEWKRVNGRKRILSLNYDDESNYLQTKSGTIIDRLSWATYEYNQEDDILKEGYSNTEEWVEEFYKRYDAQAEEEERLFRLVAGEKFTNMMQIANGVSVVQTLSFNKDGSGECYSGNATMAGISYTSELIFEWEVDDGRIRCVIDGETNYFSIEEDIWTVSLRSPSNSVYSRN